MLPIQNKPTLPPSTEPLPPSSPPHQRAPLLALLTNPSLPAFLLSLSAFLTATTTQAPRPPQNTPHPPASATPPLLSSSAASAACPASSSSSANTYRLARKRSTATGWKCAYAQRSPMPQRGSLPSAIDVSKRTHLNRLSCAPCAATRRLFDLRARGEEGRWRARGGRTARGRPDSPRRRRPPARSSLVRRGCSGGRRRRRRRGGCRAGMWRRACRANRWAACWVGGKALRRAGSGIWSRWRRLGWRRGVCRGWRWAFACEAWCVGEWRFFWERGLLGGGAGGGVEACGFRCSC